MEKRGIEENTVQNFLPDIDKEEVRKEILHGLFAERKYIQSKYFYNKEGSRLFEEITHLPEYYPTRTEKHILTGIRLTDIIPNEHLHIVELGSGDSSKISLLLDNLNEDEIARSTYYPIDFSKAALLGSAGILKEKFPGLAINGLAADFLKQLDIIPNSVPRVFCFFGSTLGNFVKEEARKFLVSLSNIMGKGDHLLLGIDMVKDIGLIERAYNDESGTTAAFNKNILNNINSIIDTDFHPSDFLHRAFFNDDERRIEMHLESKRRETIYCKYSPNPIIIEEGELIHTENSHKYTDHDIEIFSQITGLNIQEKYTDEKQWWNIVHFYK